jgi:uncharacterized integral membrane protein
MIWCLFAAFAVGMLLGATIGAVIMSIACAGKIADMQDRIEQLECELGFGGNPRLLKLTSLEKLS